MVYNKKTVDDFVAKMKSITNMNKIYVFGSGVLGKTVGSFMNLYRINWDGFLDNNSDLWGMNIDGKLVFSPNEINDIENSYIIIAVSTNLYMEQVDQIKDQLVEKGVNENAINCISLDWELTNAMDYILCDGYDTLKRNVCVKDIYKGKRCFIIGNGPSLLLEDLDKMSNDITFSCNGSIELLEKTHWRPTCFCGLDHLFLKKHVNDEYKLKHILNNCQYMFTSFRGGLYEKYQFKYEKLLYLFLFRTNDLSFSEDICKRTYSKGSSIFVLLQIAVYMGIKEIYLVGCDYSFRQELRADGSLVINNNIMNHMEHMDQVEKGRYNIDWIMEEYLCARDYANSHGIQIYNATRGGKLEVFERVDFDNLF